MNFEELQSMQKSEDVQISIPESLLPESLPLPFYEALDQFNSAQFFLCHETLEKLWIAEKSALREIYQGVLQIAVGCFHLKERANRVGAVNKLNAGARRLERAGLTDVNSYLHGVDWDNLIYYSDALRNTLIARDVGSPPDFTMDQLPIVHFTIPKQ